MRLIFILSFLLICSGFQPCRGDALEKGFEKLRIFDYFSAKASFEKAFKARPAGAAYGLCLIYSKNNNPFYQLDSARYYILFADSSFKRTTEKQQLAYKELGITAESILSQKDTLCSKAFNECIGISSIEGFEKFAKYFTFCSQKDSAITLRNKVAFNEVQIRNSSVHYKKYIDNYPNSTYVSEAKLLYEERLYEEITIKGDMDSYFTYLTLYPKGNFRLQAEKMIYLLSTSSKTLEAYDGFLKKNTVSAYRDEAWRELYKIYFKEFNEQAYQDFKKKYFGYPFMDELEEDYKLMNAQLLPFRKNELYGYINEYGKEIIKPSFEECFLFYEGLAVVKQQGKYGYINKSAKVVIPYQFDEAEPFKNKCAVVGVGDKYGLINERGVIRLPIIFDDLSDPVEDVSIVWINDMAGYYLASGEKITDCLYDFAGEFHEGYAITGNEDKFGIISKKGIAAVNQEYEQMIYLGNNLYKAKKNNKWGVLTGSGNIKVPFEYQVIADFSEGKALAAKNGKCGVINIEGKILIPFKYIFNENLINTAIFKNGYIVIKQKLKSVLMDSVGSKFNAANFDDVGMIGSGLIPVKKNKKWGYANLNGKIKINIQYQEVFPFENGFAKVIFKNKTGIIDTSGKVILPILYEEVQMKSSCFLILEKSLIGLTDFNGTVLLTTEFDKINFIGDKIAEAIKGDRKTYFHIPDRRIILKDN